MKRDDHWAESESSWTQETLNSTEKWGRLCEAGKPERTPNIHLEIAKEVDSVLCYISAAATAVSAVELEECSLCPLFPCPELLKLTGFVIIFFRTWLIWNLFFLTVKSYQDTALAELCTNSPFFKYDACVSSLMVLMTQEQAWVKLGKRGMNFTRKQNCEFGK